MMRNPRSARTMTLVMGALALCVVLLACAACSGKAALTGKWQASDGSTIEFFSDGTVSMGGGLLPITGDYTVLNRETLRMDLGGLWGLAGPQTYQYRISGRELTLVSPLGVETTLTKIK